jgi:hypothetical protein
MKEELASKGASGGGRRASEERAGGIEPRPSGLNPPDGAPSRADAHG